jgi:hypothetical protein
MERDMEKIADTELLASSAEAGTISERPPYPPSWIDRVTDWVRQLPIPAWSFYLALGIAMLVADAALNRSNGSYLASDSFPFHLVASLTPAIIGAMIHYFDDWAEKALAIFRPAMAVEEAEYEVLRYQLTTLPRLPTIVATVVGLAYGLIYTLFLYDTQIDPLKIFTSPGASAWGVAVGLLNYLVYSLIIYHTIHQMRMVSRIYGKCKQIDLLHLSPLYAFSTLAARISIAIAILAYAWIYVFSTSGGSGGIVSTLTPIFAIPLLFATFILPLVGIHRLLQDEKTKLQGENAVQLRAAIKELHRRREANDYGQIDGVGKAIDSLMKEQTLLKEIPTWPWQPETVRWVATALLVPVALALVSRIAQHWLGF